MVEAKEFGLITTCAYSVIDKKILGDNYYIEETYGVKTDVNGCFEVSIWLPKE